jgi:hypothetical protein
MTDDETYSPPPEWELEDTKDQELVAYLRSIGAKSLASELSDLRFKNRILEARRWVDFHEARMSYEEKLHDSLEERIIATQSQIFDKAQSYMNVIVTLGYAGFFAIWNFVRESILTWDSEIIAILLGLSLITFIAWTVFSVFITSKSSIEMAKILTGDYDDRESMLEAVLAKERATRRLALNLQKLWFPTFMFSVISGFGAGAILMVLLFFNILGYQFSFHDFLGIGS